MLTLNALRSATVSKQNARLSIADAKHFLNNGDLVRAFGAINYSHAWIDAAVRIGFMDGHGDDILFTLP